MHTQAFHPLNIPIAHTSLIEASAGTGKTWSIAALFLRLVLIEHLSVDKILVVTFTNAATAELKTRLRSRLDETLRELKDLPDEDASALLQQIYDQRQQDSADNAPFDEFLHQVLQQALAKEVASRLRLRLQAALNQFDHAGIFTIHGFCQRVLREFAFLCQVPFQITLSHDTFPAKQRLGADFWRRYVIQDAQRAQLCFDSGLSLQDALKNIANWFSHTPEKIDFQLASCHVNVQELEQQLHALAEKLLPQLPDYDVHFSQLHAKLNGTTYKLPTYAKLFGQILPDVLSRRQWSALPKDSHKHIGNLSAQALTEKTKKGQTITEKDANLFVDLVAWLDVIETLSEARKAFFDQLHYDLYRYLYPHWQAEKQRLQQLGFDDLLTDVAQALRHPQYGQTLATYLSEHMWNVALIDEFQDTDPLQYGIFDAIFRQNQKPVFLVGDPKQAIYRFRGADIHAYVQAKQEADALYTLATNRRTHQALVGSVNALFLNKNQPFLLEHIDYIDVQASRTESHLQPNPTPLEIQWLLEDDEPHLTKDVNRKRAAQYCALDIARHLALSQQGQLHYQDAPLQAKHIAVLVRTHTEGELVQTALRQHNISSVILSRDSIFASEQAKPVLTLLQWWLTPQQQGLLRSVLAGALLNYRSSDLMRLNDATAQDELIAWMEDAWAAQQVWQKRGIYAAWQMFDKKRGISTDFLKRDDKRGLTNVQQLFELLAHEETERFGAASLLQWFSEQIQDQASGDAYTLRLESDEALVKIVTMHSSKGLEYPIVFCPFVWDSRDFKESQFNIINQNGQVSIVSQHCLDEATTDSLRDDERSEMLRLLYVAFTRAKEKLVLSASLLKNNDSADNVLHYLITGAANATWQQVNDIWKQADKTKNQWYQQLWQTWADQHSVPLLWRPEKPQLPDAELDFDVQTAAATPYRALQTQLPFYRFQEYTSFSGISRHISHIASDELVPEMDVGELQDDQVILPEEAPSQAHEFDIFHFQRGTEAGLCLHALLEITDFSLPAHAQNERYVPVLEQYHIANEWQAALYDMIDATRLAQLDDGVCLADLPSENCLAEMGFVISVHQLQAADIQECLLAADLPASIKQAVHGLHFRDVMGFLNGFIDLICMSVNGKVYIVDYKSNHLGNLNHHYQSESMNRAITEHHYYLQALIYAIAVNRYLRSRQFEFDALHVRYLFLRGLQASSAQGVWKWDIQRAQLDKIDAVLAS